MGEDSVADLLHSPLPAERQKRSEEVEGGEDRNLSVCWLEFLVCPFLLCVTLEAVR